MTSKDYDWKSNKEKKGFPYDGDLRTNKKYLKDRKELFEKSGNGWWWFKSDSFRLAFLKRLKEDKDE